MFRWLKAQPNTHEQNVLERIAKSRANGFTSMRATGKGSMKVDAKDVINSDSFKDRAKKARDIVNCA